MAQTAGVTGAAARTTTRRYRAFGVTWATEFPWPMPQATHAPDIDVRLQLTDDVEELWSGHATADWLFRIDGRRFLIQRGTAGDFRLVQHHGARFHLSSDATVISCQPGVRSDFASQRLLLDTVLWTTALLHGHEALHSSAVLGPQGVVGFLADSGGGKTTLAVELVRRGYSLVSDDILVVERQGEGFAAHPSPPLMNIPAATPLQGMDISAIGRVGHELWARVNCASRVPGPLSRLFLLRRAPGIQERVSRMDATSLDVLPHAQAHAFVDSWERRRFELCSDIAVSIPVWGLDVDTAASPEHVADLVEAALVGTEEA